MMQRLADVWIHYANDDMKSARVLLQHGIFNMVCFHCQQAVEKMLKALLAARQQPVPRTHNLIRLRQLCQEVLNTQLQIDDDSLIFLNDIYIDSRYPADQGMLPMGFPTDEDAVMAVTCMVHVCEPLQKLYNSLTEG